MSRLGDWWDRLRALPERVVGVNRRNLQLVYPHNAREDFPVADDKLLTKQILDQAGVPTPRVLGVADGLYAVQGLVEALADAEDFVVKPARGSGGDGLLVVGARRGDGTWERAGGRILTPGALQAHLANIVFGAFSKDRPDVAFVEERIHPHPAHAALWPDGLCDLRVITLGGRPLQAMLRVPSARSEGRANLHQGGVGVAIDLETGRTTRASWRGRPVEEHPDTGAPLIGLQTPSWPDILAASHAASQVPLGYLGIDVVVDAEGRALVLEINARPGLEIQNVNGQGLGELLEGAP